jgi:glycosidase
MAHWSEKAIFYHIYPLGCLGAPQRNDFISKPVPRLAQIEQWIPHLKQLHINALYLGPLFESSAHGYDTADYYHVDRRLGNNDDLTRLVDVLHQNGIRVVLDGVFNHTGRDFFAFRDIQQHGAKSRYGDWFAGINFQQKSSYGDPFSYMGWNGNLDLAKLNLQNPQVSNYLLDVVDFWLREFQIDGLRLDAADCVGISFLQQLYTHVKQLNPEFWLMGEIIHGNYAQWVDAKALDSATNYECYKGLYSSHVDHNYFEIAYSLNRQFGENGIYRHFLPYSFADNHDVNRLASNLSNPEHVYPAYCLLFTMPGIPSIYYGSEWGIPGRKTASDDSELRLPITPDHFNEIMVNPHLADYIARLSQIRLDSPALQHGNYRQMLVNHEHFAFTRESHEEKVLVVVNASQTAQPLQLFVDDHASGKGIDLISGESLAMSNGSLFIPNLKPNSGMIIKLIP